MEGPLRSMPPRTAIVASSLNMQTSKDPAQHMPQNRAILIAGLSCACVSLTIVLITLRWFLLMKRIFRHRLVLMLVASDTCRAIWYFVFAVVAISGPPVKSESKFCQASGYLLMLSVEASDFAILLIAIHTMLCIFRPSHKSGQGGLYPYRKWILPFWLGPPILFSSLAFINGSDAYTTSGTYCFLPKRPFWYRLALSWIPRYMIIITILAMYASIYIYVHVKFRGFKNLQAAGSSVDSVSTSRRTTEAGSVGLPSPDSQTPADSLPAAATPALGRREPLLPPTFRIGASGRTTSPPERTAPWDSMSFITQLPLDPNQRLHTGVAQENFASTKAAQQRGQSDDSTASTLPTLWESRKQSEAPTMRTDFTGETDTSHATFDTAERNGSNDAGTTDHLRNTRTAIRRQLRFLFIYPLIYILMWAFPFAQHALQYDDYYVLHPPIWLGIVSTCFLALQAGVNGVVFSWREKPWRRIDKDSRFSVSFRFWQSSDQSLNQEAQKPSPTEEPQPETVHSPHWWEAEGRKRKDSVWMGTDVLTQFTSKRHQRTNTLTSINERASA